MLIAIALILGYIFSNKNWILNDIVCISTVIASIKIFKFTNLKIAIFAMCIGLAV